MKTYLTFTLGDELFAIPVKYVLEVLQRQHITRVPQTPKHVLGIINFRGEILPVVDTKLKFSLKAASILDKQIVIVVEIAENNQNLTIAAIADGVKDVIEIKEEDIKPLPELGIAFDSGFVLGAVRRNDNFTLILDIKKVFSEKELSEVQSMQIEN